MSFTPLALEGRKYDSSLSLNTLLSTCRTLANACWSFGKTASDPSGGVEGGVRSEL